MDEDCQTAKLQDPIGFNFIDIDAKQLPAKFCLQNLRTALEILGLSLKISTKKLTSQFYSLEKNLNLRQKRGGELAVRNMGHEIESLDEIDVSKCR